MLALMGMLAIPRLTSHCGLEEIAIDWIMYVVGSVN